MPFDPAAALIGLREGLEAFLVLGILLGLLARFGQNERRKVLWIGAAAGVAASVLVGILIHGLVATWFATGGGAALFEIVVALTAVCILTYMVLWMQKHTLDLMASAKRAVGRAVETGSWVVVGLLAFFTVFREGLETVLFYAARAGDVGWGTLAWSGLVGFAVSGAIAFAVFRLTVKVDLKRFFAITGALLILIAAGLLIHVQHAAADLGWIPHGEPLWDTSGVLPDEDHWLGGPLHALVGYEDQPTALGLLLYLGYIVGVGGWYFARLARKENASRARAVAASLLAALFAVFAFGAALAAPGAQHGDGHGDSHAKSDHAAALASTVAALRDYPGKVGVLVRNHGEPVHYNASTYESFKAFVDEIWPYTGLPPELLTVDQGTYYIDEAHPWSYDVHADAQLVDAWVKPWNLPAMPVSDPSGVSPYGEQFEGTYYVTPRIGPGVGEGDLYEIFALGAYRTWLKMDNLSPAYFDVEKAYGYMAEHSERHFGDKVVLAFAYSIDPKVDPNRTIEAAAKYLVDQGVDLVIDAYTSSIHSDAMNTCMMRPHTEHALHEAGFHGSIVPMEGMAGTHEAWARAVADFAATQAAEHPGATLSFHLAQHGARPESPNPCGDGPDQYHANAAKEFAIAKAAILARLGDVEVRHVYGQGAGAADDGVLSPLEALDMDRKEGIQQAIVIPYEFWGNAMDHLVNLREGFGFTPDQSPYYDAGYETHFTKNGVSVHITSGDFGLDLKAEALLMRIAQTIENQVSKA